MSETPTAVEGSMSAQAAQPRDFLVSSAPHLASGRTTRSIMFDVVIAMVPLFIASLVFFGMRTVTLTLVTVLGCLVTEAVANMMRSRKQDSLTDGSAIVTGMILAFSLPPMLPLYMGFVGGVVAIGLAKMIFGGLGQNLFNPAMVGRAFLMVCFPVALTTWAQPFDLKTIGTDGVTKATPLAVAKFHTGELPDYTDMFLGREGGSLGETSALAAIIGGIYLLLRGTADWRQPLGMLLGAMVFAAVAHYWAPDRFANVWVHLLGGGMMFGAFFIATDYVGAPVTPWGRVIFGLGVGLLVMVIRLFGGYPEGVMYAILVMNALTPLIERWTMPTPLGGKVST